MKEFTDELEVVLVDEYQDTNLLQESLYFELAKRCGGALTVVGDDDQSLYRFRGATVDLFSDFGTRYQILLLYTSDAADELLCVDPGGIPFLKINNFNRLVLT